MEEKSAHKEVLKYQNAWYASARCGCRIENGYKRAKVAHYIV